MDETDGIDQAFLQEHEIFEAPVLETDDFATEQGIGNGDGLGETGDDGEFELSEADEFRGGRRRRKRSGRGGILLRAQLLRRIEKKIDAIAKAVGAEGTEDSSSGSEGFLGFAEAESEAGDTLDEMNAGEVAIRDTDDLILEEAMGEAADTSNEIEAQSLTGATVLILTTSPLQVKRVAPAIVGGASRLVKLLRQSPRSRPLIKVVPTITKKTVATLQAKAAKGKPVTTGTVRRVMGKHAAATLKSPKQTAAALKKNQLQRHKLKRQAIGQAEEYA